MRTIIDEFSHKASSSSRYYHRHKDQVREALKSARKQNPQTWIWRAARDRAKRKKLEFTIHVEDIVIPKICPVFGVTLEVSEHSAKDNSPSLDRLDNTKGYIKGNIVVISNKANRLKGDATLQELERLVEWLKLF